MGNIMKTFALVLSVSVVLGVVCSSAHAKSTGASALRKAVQRHKAEVVRRLLTSAPAPVVVNMGEVSLMLALTPSTNRIEKFKNNFAEYVPLQRAMVLRQLGLPLHNLLAEDHDFRDTVLMKAMRMQGYDDSSYISGDQLIDTGLEKYLPSVYELSAEDVLDSAEALDDFGNPTQTGRWSNEEIFNFNGVVRILDSSLGDTGRRDIIANLNKLDFDAADEFVRKFSLAWSLRILQVDSDLEAAQETAAPSQILLDIELQRIISSKQKKLERDKESVNKTPFFAPSAQEIEQLELEIKALQNLDAMPHSPERGVALAEFHANYLTNSNALLNFTDKDLEWLRRNKIGQAVLQDITPPALAVLSQVAALDSYYRPLMDKSLRQEQLLGLLDEELQLALAAKQ